MFKAYRAAGVAFAQRPHTRRSFLIMLTIALSVATYWFSRFYVDELAARSLAVFVVAVVFWATETLPLFATAFVVIGLEIIFLATDGGLADPLTRFLIWMGLEVETVHEIRYTRFFEPFAKDIIILFMGGFLLSAALTKHNIDRAIARRILRPFSHSPFMMLCAVIVITAFFSMWMSNTATAAMMLAIISPVVAKFPKDDRFHRGLVLGVAFGANIGGIGTPIGTPPNAIAYGALNAAGYEVSFLSWMKVAVPLEILLLVIVSLLLYFLFRPERGLKIERLELVQQISVRGWTTVAILVATIIMWLTGELHGIRPGAVALLSAAALSALAVIDRRDVDSIDWNILILMWGGLSLSVAMTDSGLADVIAGVNLNDLPGGTWVLAIAVTIVAVTMSTFMSNTATASLIVPMALAAYLTDKEQYAMLAALACSFAMAMPVSTPPNAMAYATGHVPIASMFRVGTLMTAICIIILLLGYKTMLPIIL
jgi:sodium-dependent dicarboxylate transporter 2/3/5